MELDIKNAIKDFETLKLEIKEKEFKASELKELIAPYIIENHKDDELQLEHGKITVKHRSKWEYSERLENEAKQLKKRQKEEVAKGEANDNGIDYIEYSQDK